MEVVYAREPLPTKVLSTIFLAGPTPRSPDVPSWRPQALALLLIGGFPGHVFVPEDRGQSGMHGDWLEQVTWEDKALNRADCIVFWIPRVMADMPALTTNDEWGFWKKSGKIIGGAPRGAPHTSYQQHYARQFNAPWYNSLPDVCEVARESVWPGAIREGWDCTVPLKMWHLPEFQRWRAAQMAAGRNLDDVRIDWRAIGELLQKPRSEWDTFREVLSAIQDGFQ